MKVLPLHIPEILLITPLRIDDGRGYFCETYNEHSFASHGLTDQFVQDNQSLSTDAGVVRGLHFQIEPKAQTKLVRVLKGRIFDVAVDIRAGSPTFGQYVSAELDADTGDQLYIPAGFAHGFMTLVKNTEVLYKVSDSYAPEYDRGITWDDPTLSIDWPLEAIGGRKKVIVSDKDQTLMAFDDYQNDFNYVPD